MSFQIVIAVVSCALIGAGCLAYGFYQRQKIQASQSWPQVPGRITKAEIAVDKGPDSGGYIVQVLYDYAVNGVAYTGKRIGFDQRTYARKKRAQSVLDRYPINATVPVYFDPAKPTDAVLSREYPDSLMLILMGAAFLILDVVIVVYESAR